MTSADMRVSTNGAEELAPTEPVFGSTENDNDEVTDYETTPVEPAATPGLVYQSLDGAIRACAEWNGGKGLFGNDWEDKVNQGLIPAFVLALELQLLGSRAVERVLEETYFKQSKLKPQKKKVCGIAVRLAFKPFNEGTGKLCYDYAALVERACQIGISPEAFPEWVNDTDISTCKRQLAEEKRAARGAHLVDEHGVKSDPDSAIAKAVVLRAAVTREVLRPMLESADPTALKTAIVKTIADYTGSDVLGLFAALTTELAACQGKPT